MGPAQGELPCAVGCAARRPRDVLRVNTAAGMCMKRFGRSTVKGMPEAASAASDSR